MYSNITTAAASANNTTSTTVIYYFMAITIPKLQMYATIKMLILISLGLNDDRAVYHCHNCHLGR